MPQANKPDYDPTRPPQFQAGSDADVLSQWVNREMHALAISMLDKTAVELRPIDVPPPKPREGMIVFADGVHWNPGIGKGPYVFVNGAWIPLADNTLLTATEFRVRRATTQSVTSGTWTKIAFDTIDIDTGNWWNSSLARYIPQIGGFYVLEASGGGPASTSTGISIVKNGTGAGTISATSVAAYSAVFGPATSVSSVGAVVRMNGTTDFIELWGMGQGGTTTITAAVLSGVRV